MSGILATVGVLAAFLLAAWAWQRFMCGTLDNHAPVSKLGTISTCRHCFAAVEYDPTYDIWCRVHRWDRP